MSATACRPAWLNLSFVFQRRTLVFPMLFLSSPKAKTVKHVVVTVVHGGRDVRGVENVCVGVQNQFRTGEPVIYW